MSSLYWHLLDQEAMLVVSVVAALPGLLLLLQAPLGMGLVAGAFWNYK